jgi:hypothetical protein
MTKASSRLTPIPTSRESVSISTRPPSREARQPREQDHPRKQLMEENNRQSKDEESRRFEEFAKILGMSPQAVYETFKTAKESFLE